jgi:hypothetical protein
MPVKELRLLAFVALAAIAGTGAFAQEQPRGLLGATDLKSIVLSPAPLGPPARFEPPAAVARTETVQRVATSEAKTETTAPRKGASTRARSKTAIAARKAKRSPLNSFARDVQRQTWPCTGGGICGWTQPR